MSGREYAELKSLSCRATRTWFTTRDPWFDPPEEEEIDEEDDEEDFEDYEEDSDIHTM